MNNIQYLISKPYRKNRSRKAVSPVISTIIIVAIAIAISIAVALYLTGITGQFTKFERLDVTSAYANPIDTATGKSTIDIDVKNSGTSTLTIDRILLNGKPTNLAAVWNPASGDDPNTSSIGTYTMDGSGKITVVQGDSGTIHVDIPGKSGQSFELTLHTVSGKEYPKVVLLP